MYYQISGHEKVNQLFVLNIARPMAKHGAVEAMPRFGCDN
jgi:hypothetical protein